MLTLIDDVFMYPYEHTHITLVVDPSFERVTVQHLECWLCYGFQLSVAAHGRQSIAPSLFLCNKT